MKVLLKIESPDETQGEAKVKTPLASTNAAKFSKSSDRKQRENVANLPIGQSKQEQERKRHKARNRKWFGKRDNTKHDEENGMVKGQWHG